MLQLENLDVFVHTDSEYRVQTRSGAIISIVALLVMIILFFTELSIYLSTDIKPELYVDTSLGQNIQINLDITFHSLPCAFISVNAMDKTGNHQLNIVNDVFTTRLDGFGAPIPDAPVEREVVGLDNKDTVMVDLAKPAGPGSELGCASCYGAESPDKPCCPTCNDVQEAYRKKGWAFIDAHRIEQCVAEGLVDKLKNQKNEGCRVHGNLHVSRVAGNFNIVPGKLILQNSRYVVDSDLYHMDGGFNVSHKIHHLSFGIEYPGRRNPLDGVEKVWSEKNSSPMYEYFVKVVPTIYEDLYGNVINTNQFSVTEYEQKIDARIYGFGGSGVPGLFFMYDLSPITVDFKESGKSFLHFLMHLCAIIGGIFTTASLVDAFLYNGLNTIKKK